MAGRSETDSSETTENARWAGSCLCGAVRYEATGSPVRINHCHCIQCRKASGAGVATWVMFERQQVRLWGAAPVDHASSERAIRQYCPNCHSNLTWKSADTPQYIDIAAGTLDRAPDFSAEEHLFFGNRVAWLPIDDGLPKHDAWRED